MIQKIDGVDFTVDEHIWGHRLYDEQLPHLAVLEFLGVLGSNVDSQNWIFDLRTISDLRINSDSENPVEIRECLGIPWRFRGMQARSLLKYR